MYNPFTNNIIKNNNIDIKLKLSKVILIKIASQ